MIVLKARDLIEDESFVITNDAAIVMSDWELNEVKSFLERWIPKENIIRCQAVGRLLSDIKNFEKENENGN